MALLGLTMRTVHPTAASFASAAVSVGVDLVDVPRIARLLQDPGAAPRLLTASERAYCSARPGAAAEHAAARFAAKEAVLKAFGTGLRDGLRWVDVEVVNDPDGRPSIRLHGAARALAARRGLRAIEISLSHTADLAIAHAVAVWSPPDHQDHGGIA
jgi:holo-[acyl-carrier protein] synthase